MICMAVLQMQRISICALKKDRKQILDLLQRRGVVEISDILQEDSVFQKTDMSSSQAVFEKSTIAAEHALIILETYVPENKSMLSSLEGKDPISGERYDHLCSSCDNVMKQAFRIIDLDKEIAEHKANIQKAAIQIEPLIPWLALDVPMNFKGTKNTSAFIGSFPSNLTLEEIYEGIAENKPEIGEFSVEVISVSKDQTCVFILCRKSDMAEMEDALRSMAFTYPSSPSGRVPAESKRVLEEAIESHTVKITEAESEIKDYAALRDEIKFMYDYYTLRAEKYGVISNLLQSKRTFVLTGYMPTIYSAELEERLNAQFDVAIEFEEVAQHDDVPVLLKNSKLTEPVEGVLESFGLPTDIEIDPIPLMSVTYYILFGLMFSDAAYGLILFSVCGFLLLKYKNMAYSMKKSLKMFFYCGITTTFWGVMFGSYFGDGISVIAETFFGKTLVIPAVWFIPLNDPMRMLIFCMAIGVVHLFMGLVVQFYQFYKAKMYKEAIFDVLTWVALVGGLILVLLPTDLFMGIASMTEPLLPPVFTTIGMVSAGLGAVGILLMEGRTSKSWIKRILKGAYGLYNVTGYLSDILSYSRLLALGLATGVIASVVNQMGAMKGNSVGGVIMFILVFVVGHLFNIAISMLGAYVHTNRLEFVEFFSKFYEGGGRKFNPFSTKSKYYHIKEEIKQ